VPRTYHGSPHAPRDATRRAQRAARIDYGRCPRSGPPSDNRTNPGGVPCNTRGVVSPQHTSFARPLGRPLRGRPVRVISASARIPSEAPPARRPSTGRPRSPDDDLDPTPPTGGGLARRAGGHRSHASTGSGLGTRLDGAAGDRTNAVGKTPRWLGICAERPARDGPSHSPAPTEKHARSLGPSANRAIWRGFSVGLHRLADCAKTADQQSMGVLRRESDFADSGRSRDCRDADTRRGKGARGRS